MRDVLIDVRCLQDPAPDANPIGTQAQALVAAARLGLPGDRLVGLVDPLLAPLPPGVAATFDALRGPITPGAVRRPACLVQLSPLHDPLFVIRLLLCRSVASVTVNLPELPPHMDPIAQAARRHWHARYRLVADAAKPDAFWSAVAAMQPGDPPALVGRKRAQVALLASAAEPALVGALGAVVDLHLLAPDQGGVPPFHFLTRRFDRILGVVDNAAASAPVTRALARYGGACLLRDAGLLAIYDAAPAMAEAELGRCLGPNERQRWKAGEVRPGAWFLGELAGTADPLIVHSHTLAAEVRRRFGRAPAVVPRPVLSAEPVRARARARLGIAAQDVLLAAVVQPDLEESCLWALDLLRFWGRPARLHLIGPPPWNWPHLRALAGRLGLAEQVALVPQRLAALHWDAADLGLMLAVGADHRSGVALQEAAASGLPCVAAETVAMTIDPPHWVRTVPDETSPILLAEAILDLHRAQPDPTARRDYAARHSPEAAAAALCAALAL